MRQREQLGWGKAHIRKRGVSGNFSLTEAKAVQGWGRKKTPEVGKKKTVRKKKTPKGNRWVLVHTRGSKVFIRPHSEV